MRALDRLDAARRLRRSVAGSGSVELPVGVHAAAAGLDSRWHGRSARNAHRGQLSGPVDVDPQKAGVRDGVLVAARLRRPRGDEHLLAAVRVAGREREQRLKPAARAAGAAGQVVLAAARVSISAARRATACRP